ncbi:hypothetical protein CSW23_08265 [Thermus scotoductus]|uniref:Uncharacterized protein n=1 Tax=Thermus scotoductus TaxID=37636 RepID=A0A430V0L0_THESC|nr:hypothetical protein CSW23_08260 [Thermus scotoductus]RTI15726.1 hypothetical protein CSW23_08265 [Thermus scotoductus]
MLASMVNFFLSVSYLGPLVGLLASPRSPAALVVALSRADLSMARPWVAALAVYARRSGVSLAGLGPEALAAS